MLGMLTSIVWIPLIVYGAFVSWRNRDRRGQQARRIIYFVVAFFALHALLMTTQTMSAMHAGCLVKAVEQFNAEHGYCPALLKEMGIEEDFDQEQSRGYKGVAYYDGAVFYPGILPFSSVVCPSVRANRALGCREADVNDRRLRGREWRYRSIPQQAGHMRSSEF
jgi:hypothetical protein